MITQKQIKKIYATAHEIGLNNENLHSFIGGIVSKDSVKMLTFAEANEVISELERRNHVPLSEKMTDAQRTKIWMLIFELEHYDPLPNGSRDERIRRLTGIANKLFKREPTAKFYINELSKSDASQLIDALKRYIRQAQRRQDGDA